MKILNLLLLTILSSNLFAQLNPKTKWGDISQAEIDYKEVSFEPNANAVILYESGDMLIAYQDLGNKIHKRIKILTEKGKIEANKDIIYYAYNNIEDIKDIKAQTINFENGKKVITQVKQKDIYDVPYEGYYRSKRFAFPNVKVGSIIEFEYTLINEFHYYIEGWDFQHKLPTLYSSFNINVQVPIDYVPICIGDKIVEYINTHRKKNKHKSSWALTDIPSLKKIDFTYNERDFGEQIDFQLKGYYNKSNRYVNEIITWTDLNKKFIDENLKKTDDSYVEMISKRILDSKNDREQFKNVLNYFSKNYFWDEEYSIFLTKSFKELDALKKGNTAELNLLFYNLLRYKGIKTQLVLVSSRHNRKIQTAYPYFNQFTNFINLVTFKDGSTLLLDAIHLPKYDYEFMPLRNYNHHGLILDAFNEQFITVSPPLSEAYSTQNYIFSNNRFVLSRIDKSNGYLNLESQNHPSQIDNSLNINLVEKTKSTPILVEDKYLAIKTISQSNAENQPFYIYQNPLLKIINQYKFEEPSRKQPLEFDFPFYYNINSTTKIPEGYTVEIPKNFNSKHEVGNKELIYYQNAEVKDGTLIYSVELLMKTSTFTNQYKEIKSFFEKSNLDAAKTILLKKI